MTTALQSMRHLFAAAAALLACAASARAETFSMPPAGSDIIGELRIVTAKHEDTLLDIARRFNLGYNEIVAANPRVDPWLPGAGTQVIVPTQFVLPPGPRQGIVLNLAQMRLFYFIPGKPQVMTQPVGIGTDYARTPLGDTKIVRKTANPVWRPSRDIREEHSAAGHWLEREVPAGPDNPLGKFALYLGMKGSYLIHGTNKPWGIGMRVSHGCIRMYPEGIEALFSAVPVGTPVRIIDERFVFGSRDKVPYLQAFAPEEGDDDQGSDLTPLVQTLLRRAPEGAKPDLSRLVSVASERRGIPLPVSAGSASLKEIVQKAAATAQPAQ
jgi:L,D-transpeptidase ErfK/SrfK